METGKRRLQIALYRPEIPPNTGNIARLSICTGSRLHIVGEPSFSLDEAAVRRAGIDYWHRVDLTRHEDWPGFTGAMEAEASGPLLLFTRFADSLYCDYEFQGNEVLVFGRESSGLPTEVLEYATTNPLSRALRIPVADDCRSLNLGNAVAVVLYEALRQTDFAGVRKPPPAR